MPEMEQIGVEGIFVTDDFNKGIEEYNSGLDKANVRTREFTKQVEKMTRDAEAEVKKLGQAFNKDYVGGLNKSTVSTKEFQSALMGSAQASGLSTRELQRMAESSGLYSAQSLKAAAASENVARKADELTKAVASGKISAQEAGRQFSEYAKTQEVVAAKTKTTSALLSDMKSKLQLVALAAVAAGTAFAVKFIKESVDAASNLAETTNKIKVIFGSASDEVIAFSKTAGTALGQSQQKAMDAAATFSLFGKSAGLAGKELVSFSTRLVTLASDLASFYNTTPEDAILAIGAALRGESEPIRRYNVLLNDAVLKQKALEMGVIDTTSKALTPQQRVLVATEEIFRQTAVAQGDFANTSTGLANQQRILNAATEDLKVQLGEGFLPIVTKATTELAKYAGEMNKVEELQEQLTKAEDAGVLGYWEVSKAVEDMRWRKEGLVTTEKLLAQTMGYGVKETGFLEAGMRTLANQTTKTTSAIEANIVMTRQMVPQAEAGYRQAQRLAQAGRDYQWQLEQNMVKLGELQTLISGQVGPTIENYRKTSQDLNTQLQEEQDKLAKLVSQGYGPMSDKVLEAQGRIDGLNAKLQENQAQYERTMKSIMFNLLAQQAATEGLTTQELTLLTKVAEHWGLVDQATADSTRAAGQALDDFAHGQGMNATLAQLDRAAGLAGGISRELKGLNGKTFTMDILVNTNYHGGPPVSAPTTTTTTPPKTTIPGSTRPKERGGAHGLNFMVPPGYPDDSYRFRATSGEQVIIVPKPAAGKVTPIQFTPRLSLPPSQSNVSNSRTLNMGGVNIYNSIGEGALQGMLQRALWRGSL